MSFTSTFGGGDINLGNRMYKDFMTVSGYVCNGLFSINCFLNSDIVHVLRTENLRADSLARSARKQLFFVVHMDAELAIWFTESI
uniref:Uncharacterized protein n=1 Tax=Brassica oleracea var. oleracea TaxID=109376 RepID=A0A0D3CP55_BRAOL